MPAAESAWLGFSRRQWLVIAAAWAGWGFDVFDAVLFNFVASDCIPALEGLPAGSAAARAATLLWTGILTSLLLVGWATGGVLFGWVADRIGRRRALFATILAYSLGTALCAAATNVWALAACRVIASFGIGGEWGVGAALVAETVPENRRVLAGVLLQSASPLGVVLASAVNYLVAGVWLVGEPQVAWRYVFLAGLLPALLALAVRVGVPESDEWARECDRERPPSPRELFDRQWRAATISGIVVAVTGVLTWWACNAFLPLLGSSLGAAEAARRGLAPDAARVLAEGWKALASNAFNLGGLLGAFAAIVLAQRLGRRAMYAAYFGYSALTLWLVFGLPLDPAARIAGLFFVGAGVFGVFGTFPFYLPELFPARLRASGAGLCYNIGRLVAALGPFAVGMITARSDGSGAMLVQALAWAGCLPGVVALAARYLIVEPRVIPAHPRAGYGGLPRADASS